MTGWQTSRSLQRVSSLQIHSFLRSLCRKIYGLRSKNVNCEFGNQILTWLHLIEILLILNLQFNCALFLLSKHPRKLGRCCHSRSHYLYFTVCVCVYGIVITLKTVPSCPCSLYILKPLQYTTFMPMTLQNPKPRLLSQSTRWSKHCVKVSSYILQKRNVFSHR